MNPACWQWILRVLVVCGGALNAAAQTTMFNGVEVPGVVIAHIPKSADYKYNSPAITILPNGDYIAAHDVTGNNAPSPTQTYIHRSTDQGQTWTQIATISGQQWANLFVYENNLYLMGTNGGRVVIRKSTNGGVTWTNPTNVSNGLIASTNSTTTYHTGPMPMLVADGRLWRSIESRVPGGASDALHAGMMSMPLGADPLLASSWTFTNRILSEDGWLPSNGFSSWREGNAVVDRDGNIVNLIRVDTPRGTSEKAAIMHVQNPTSITFDPGSDIIDFNGGAKKFTVRYDADTDLYWSFANLITPANRAPTILPSSHRDIVAMVSSPDLRNWDVRKVIVQDTSDMENIGFQYWDWEYDGDDIIAASRTAYPDGLGGAIRFHDANFFTFHRVRDYATATPTHVLVADTANHRVMRYEVTETAGWLEIGRFNLGTSFAGATMQTPLGLAQDAAGRVYVSEQRDGGRVLQFDASGNFLRVVAADGAQFTGRPEALTMGPDGRLYMSVAFGTTSDKVYRIDPDSGQTTLFIDTAFAGGTLNNPRAIAFGDDGHLYVADRENNVFRRFHGQTGAFLGNLYTAIQPEGLAWDELHSRLIGAYRDDGDANLVALGTSGGASTLYNLSNVGQSLGLVVIDGDIFWSDYNNGRVYQLTGTNAIANSVTGLRNPGHLLQVTGPPTGERAWTRAGSGNWSDSLNWFYYTRPDTPGEVAFFGSAAPGNATITMNAAYRLTGLRFRHTGKYTLSGAGSLAIDAGDGRGVFDTQLGEHDIFVPVTLHSDTDAITADTAVLRFRGNLHLNGRELYVTGPGRLWVHQQFTMNGGSLILDGAAPFSFATTADTTLDGAIELRLADGDAAGLGDSFDLINGSAYLDGTFNTIVLPGLDPGLGWDLSTFYGNGIVTVVAMLLTGDANGDGVVDAGDFLAVEQHLGSLGVAGAYSPGDANHDGVVNGADFLAVERHFGDVWSSAAGFAPEPASALFVLLPLLSGRLCRRQ